MLLKSDESMRLHRAKKRHLEIGRIIEVIQGSSFVKNKKTPRVLEFGCGNGFQIPYLSRLGSVIATDIYTSDELRVHRNWSFCESNIYELPFADNSFDIIFSNHVVEHLHEPAEAFSELNRVAKSGCLFVFSVPTNYWLLLALPSKYLGKLEEGWRMMSACFKSNSENSIKSDLQKRMSIESRLHNSNSPKGGLLSLLLPRGHGVYREYGKCFKAFSVKSWKLFFCNHGFHIREIVPLLLYGPSERPVIATTSRFNRFGICSSALFLLSSECRNICRENSENE